MSNNLENITISKESHVYLLNKVLEFKTEERNMALDRYRKADDTMSSSEEFMILGKTAISFLNAASEASSYMGEIAKEISKIVNREEAPLTQINNFNQSEDEKRAIKEAVKSILMEKHRGVKEESDSEQSKDDE